MSLHTADPGRHRAAAKSAGGAYARQGPVTFANAGNNPTVASNSAIVTYSATASWGTLTFFGLWDSATAGISRLWPAECADHGQLWRRGALSRQFHDHHGGLMASLYGKGNWGTATYSYAPATNEHVVTGNIGPLVTLGAARTGARGIAGQMTPRITLAASASSDERHVLDACRALLDGDVDPD